MYKTHNSLQLHYSALTDIGLGRSNNEDVWIALPEYNFFAIADGMGGHNGGEVAAALAIESLSDSMKTMKASDCTELMIELRLAIQKANNQVFKLSSLNPELSGMGTTLCCLCFTPKSVIYAHVGDSRIYRMRDEKLELLTEDHSLFTKWQMLGREAQDKSHYPYKHVITRAVGTAERVKPSLSRCDYRPGDLYLLCTDGISDILPLNEMEKSLLATSDLKACCYLLIEEAKKKGGSDNMTLLLVQTNTQKS